jgi:glycolate dehydrogenase FAD-binding subunit
LNRQSAVGSRQSPASPDDAAALLLEAAQAGRAVRFVGGGTKLGWGAVPPEPQVELSTAGLNRIVEHNAGDLTAVLEAGAPLAQAQALFAKAGQMLALDPPDRGGATIGGVVASGDSGPLRARFGAARDLVLGMRIALPDGTVAKAGGRVIKNVAGYDLAKLLTGSFGTLGLIAELAVRLHPLPGETITAAAGTTESAALARAALELSHAPLEPLSLDVRWGGGGGALVARFGGAAPRPAAEEALARMSQAGLGGELVDDDEAIWDKQREGQRSDSATVVRVAGVQTQLGDVLDAATRLGARLVGRPGLGLSWLSLVERGPEDAVAAVTELRHDLAPASCVVLDAPEEVRSAVDPWGPLASPELVRRVRERFDPAGVCNPGVLPA